MKITISKIEAAKRQLETAIMLYFHYADIVSIHTLASASFNVLNDISAYQKAEITHIRNTFLSAVKPEHIKEVVNHLKNAENFFKHADRDPESQISFTPKSTDFVLIDAVELYIGLTGEIPALLGMYRGWWQGTYRHLLLDKQSNEYIVFNKNSDLLENRRAFYSTLLPEFLKLAI